MRRTFHAIAAFGAFTALVPSQQTTAHPQDSLQTNGGLFVPFGVATAGAFGEGRTHILVPRNELPSEVAVLTGIQIQATDTATLTYAQLAIGVSPFVGATLSTSFAANITAPLAQMLPAGPLTISWISNTWTTLPTNGFYVHDGRSDMLIEIRKSVLLQTPGATPTLATASGGFPVRTDRPTMRYEFGIPGSGASSAVTAGTLARPINYRLVWDTQPTLRNRQDRIGSQNQYALGSTVELMMAGQPGQLWVLAAGSGFLPQAVPIPGMRGALRIAGPVVFAGGVLGAGGEAIQPVVLPTSPSLVGFYLVYQGAIVDPGSGVITLTNGTDHFINP